MQTKEEQDKKEYLQYLFYAQLGQPEPEKTYTDWSGEEVLSFKEWCERKDSQKSYGPKTDQCG